MENIESIQAPISAHSKLEGFVSTSKLLEITRMDSSQLTDALRMIAGQFGVSPTIARRILSKLASSGNFDYPSLKAFLSDSPTKAGTVRDINKTQAETPINQTKANPQQTKTQAPEEFVANKNSANIFKASLRQDVNLRSDFAPRANIPQELKAAPPPLKNNLQILSQLVSTPQNFASWLVNNRAAFVGLKTSPEVTYMLTALANPKLQMSPLMLAEFAKILAVLIKIKLGKASPDEIDEMILEERVQESLLEDSDKDHSTVGGVRGAIKNIPVAALKDFLLEAERFAEEEIANRWSLNLKREKEVEHAVLTQFEKLQGRRTHDER